MYKGVYKIIICTLLFSCQEDLPIIQGCTDINASNWISVANFDDGSCIYYQTTPYQIITPFGFPDMIVPVNNQLTVEGIELGKKIFNDPILSANNTLSCSGCHIKTITNGKNMNH